MSPKCSSFYRVIEELKGKRRIPLEESKTYMLLDLKELLKNKNQEFLMTMEKLSQYHAVILNMVLVDLLWKIPGLEPLWKSF